MKKSIDSYSEILEIIFEINTLHNQFSVERDNILTYNLSKYVRTVVDGNGIDREFQTLIGEYKSDLNSSIIDILSLQNQFPSIRFRLKQAESINEKLIYYMSEAHENGKISLNKCLNDLLGFRILVKDFDNICEDLKAETSVKENIKIYLRKDGKYRGLHLHFKNGNNKFFPWELQIWDVNHSELNEISHKEHKQKRKYISVPQNYYEANLESEE